MNGKGENVLTALLNGKKITATDPNWNDRKEEYRALCNNQAVCPICQEKIICRFGEINQHHFAHRRNNDCPGNNDTKEHMIGKAILYDFLLERYGGEGSIELEYYIPELKMTCDFIVNFHDGRKWAVEFYCGGKVEDLKNKINFYDEQGIMVTWLLSQQLYREYDSGKALKISTSERLLISNTGIDKYYIGDWYKRIVIDGQKTSLPLDRDSWGSLIYLSIEKKELRIFRALHRSHHNIYYYHQLLKGALDEVIIRFKRKWGVNWYFEQEKELGNKYTEAQKVLKELRVSDNCRQNVNTINRIRLEQGKYAPKSYNIRFNSPLDNYHYRNDWDLKEPETPRIRYQCIHCQKEFNSGGMVHIFHYNEPEGICRECSKKREQ